MRGSRSGTGTSCRHTSIPRYTDYARACASIGINGAVLTNVNANATSLTPAYLDKAAALAGVLRPYGVRVYLTARFSAPIELGGLKTADPLDPAVRAWWKAKADEIYARDPRLRRLPRQGELGGTAGPAGLQAHACRRREHAGGSRGAAWRRRDVARVRLLATKRPTIAPSRPTTSSCRSTASSRDNVLVQVKNGAIDFQPREPFHPLFGAMPKTPLMMEFQITKEYLGLRHAPRVSRHAVRRGAGLGHDA